MSSRSLVYRAGPVDALVVRVLGVGGPAARTRAPAMSAIYENLRQLITVAACLLREPCYERKVLTEYKRCLFLGIPSLDSVWPAQKRSGR